MNRSDTHQVAELLRTTYRDVEPSTDLVEAIRAMADSPTALAQQDPLRAADSPRNNKRTWAPLSVAAAVAVVAVGAGIFTITADREEPLPPVQAPNAVPRSVATTTVTVVETASVIGDVGDLRDVLTGLGYFCDEPFVNEELPSAAPTRVICRDVPGEPVAGDLYVMAEFGYSKLDLKNVQLSLGDTAGPHYDGSQLVYSKTQGWDDGWVITLVPGVSDSGADKVDTEPEVVRAAALRIQQATGGAIFPG